MTAASSDLLPPQCPSWHWDWDRTAEPPQSSVLGSGAGEAAEPVSSAEGDSVGCCHRAVDGAVSLPAVSKQAVPVGCCISEPELSTACATAVGSDFQKSEAETRG